MLPRIKEARNVSTSSQLPCSLLTDNSESTDKSSAELPKKNMQQD